jgi:hypothetical protein
MKQRFHDNTTAIISPSADLYRISTFSAQLNQPFDGFLKFLYKLHDFFFALGIGGIHKPQLSMINDWCHLATISLVQGQHLIMGQLVEVVVERA